MRAEIWFYEADPEISDPVLIKSLGELPKARKGLYGNPPDWECGNTVAGDCTVKEMWEAIADSLGIVLKKLGDV